MTIFCIIAVRNEQRFLPGFLHHMRDHVDGIIALDDCSTDATPEILKREPKVVSILRQERAGAPHAHETENRYRLLREAARLGARWLICADADERFEEALLRRLPEEVVHGERTGRHLRLVRIVNLWNSRHFYRANGPSGPRWTVRMFRLPDAFSARAPGLHHPWFPPEIERAPRAKMSAYLYHLRMIERRDRVARFEKFLAADPRNRHQRMGYRHLIEEESLQLRPVLPWRRFVDVPGAWTGGAPGTDVGAVETPGEAGFDELFYLNEHADVRRAVSGGRFATGWEHFERVGAGEQRRWRRRAALTGLDFGAVLSAWRERRS